MLVRIAAIITMVRWYEEQKKESITYCSNTDFQTAFWMIRKSLASSLSFFTSLPNTVDTKSGTRKAIFYNSLPLEFDAPTYTNIATDISIPTRTAQRYIESFVKTGALESFQKGHYIKQQLGINAAMLTSH